MRNQVILFQGDSITDCSRARELTAANSGMGLGYAFMIASRLLAEHPGDALQIYNRGISGNRVVDLYARWKIDALNLKPDVLSILIGVNDTWHEFECANGVEVERYNTFYRMLLDWTLAERPEIKLVLIEPFVLETGVVTPAWVSEINERRAMVRQIAAEDGTMFVPAQEIFDAALKEAPAAYWLPDGVHPSMAGHQRLTDAWLKVAGNVI